MSIGNRSHPHRTLLRSLLFPVLLVAVGLVFLSAISNLEYSQSETGVQQLEQSLRRACVTCYATQGVYPPDLAYLETHYGLQINDEQYIVYYDVFAENIMPDITVLERER